MTPQQQKALAREFRWYTISRLDNLNTHPSLLPNGGKVGRDRCILFKNQIMVAVKVDDAIMRSLRRPGKSTRPTGTCATQRNCRGCKYLSE